MTKYQKTGIISLASLLIVAAPQLRAGSDAATSNRGQLSRADYKFACEAAQGGSFEVRAGELARSQGFNPAVKQFGERMIADHSKANQQLQALAANKGATLPTALDHKQQRMLDELSKLSGKDFDKAYAVGMVKDHKEDLKEFQKEAQTADDADLRSFASTTAGIISQHLDLGQQMKATVEREIQTAGP